jgi:hypothetical protein
MQEATRALGVTRQTVLQRVKGGEIEAAHVTKGGKTGLRVKLDRQPSLFEPHKIAGLVDLAVDVPLMLVCRIGGNDGRRPTKRQVHPQLLGIIAHVADQASVGRQFRGQFVGCRDVRDVACGQDKAEQSALTVGDTADLRRSALGHGRHQRVEDPLPAATTAPAIEAIVDRRVGSIDRWQSFQRQPLRRT